MSNNNIEWKPPIQMSATMTMPNGGKVVMTAPPAHDWNTAKANLQTTHQLYLQYGGWGGP